MGAVNKPRTGVPARWDVLLDQWAVHLVARGRAPSTVGKRVRVVRGFADDTGCTDPATVVLDDLTVWVAEHAATSKTAYGYRAAFRLFFSWAHDAGHLAENPAVLLDAANGGRPVARRVSRPVGTRGPLPKWTPSGWEPAIAEWTADLRARGISRETIRTHSGFVRRVARAFANVGPFEVTFRDLVEWLAQFDRWSAETRRSARSALRSFYRWAHEAEHVATDPSAKLPSIYSKAPMPRPASETAVKFAVLTATPRERLMVRLAAELGMRRAEVAQVHSRDLVEHDAGWSLIVHGKGARTRVLPLIDELASELRSLPPGWAFPGQGDGHMTAGTVGVLVKRLLPPGVTMHALRHRFATRLYEQTHDILTVQRLLGHARPETTQRYVEVADDRLRAAVVGLANSTTRSSQPWAATS